MDRNEKKKTLIETIKDKWPLVWKKDVDLILNIDNQRNFRLLQKLDEVSNKTTELEARIQMERSKNEFIVTKLQEINTKLYSIAGELSILASDVLEVTYYVPEKD